MNNQEIRNGLTYSVYYNVQTRLPLWAKVSGYFATEADAKVFAANFPKSCRLKSTIIHSNYSVQGYIHMQAQLHPDNKLGTINETGLKRFNSFLKTCKKLGVSVVYVMNAGNSYTEAEAKNVLEA